MPRLWMTPPAKMCLQHLLGEHHETHMFLGKLKLKHRLYGYIIGNHFALADLHPRHEVLAAELVRRNRQHNSPFPRLDLVLGLGDYLEGHPPVDRQAAAKELYQRCAACRHLSTTGASA